MDTNSTHDRSTAPVTGTRLDFDSELVMPSQFFGETRFNASQQPERRLMLAVIEEAVGTFQRHACSTDQQGRTLFAEAEDWFYADDTAWPFSFVNICRALDLDEDHLRAGLRRWCDRQRVAQAGGPRLYRFPFRRAAGTRHKATGRPIGLKRSA